MPFGLEAPASGAAYPRSSGSKKMNDATGTFPFGPCLSLMPGTTVCCARISACVHAGGAWSLEVHMSRHFVSAVGALVLGLSLATSQLQAAESASDCVTILRSQLSSGVSYAVNNSCGENLGCSMSWTVQCENAAGKVSSRTRGGTKFSLSANDGHEVIASADQCTSGWDITDVAWSCNKTKSLRVTLRR
jgi:hypothetical protein